jgi:NTP pyrophosphatase (non-canonical NTP hydrolase)
MTTPTQPQPTAPAEQPRPVPPKPVAPKPVPQDEPVIMKIVLDAEQVDAQFVCLFSRAADQFNQNAQVKGFWEAPVNVPEKLALMHSEISEALEAVRNGNPPDDKVPEFSSLEMELADVMIRVMDFGRQHNLRLAEAILAKHKYNKTRPFKHGKRF